jgi:hypothetical protein
MGIKLQVMAYQRLQTSSLTQGDAAEAALFGYLVAKFDGANRERAGLQPQSTFGRETSERNAAVVEISGVMIIFFSGLVVVAALILTAGSRRSARLTARRARPLAIIVILASAAGLLFSSITLYLTYRPYFYIFQSAILNGDRLPTSDLRYFLNYTPTLSAISPRGYQVLLNAVLYSGSPGILFYVWAGVTLLGVIGLILILVRRLRSRPRTKPPESRRLHAGPGKRRHAGGSNTIVPSGSRLCHGPDSGSCQKRACADRGDVCPFRVPAPLRGQPPQRARLCRGGYSARG